MADIVVVGGGPAGVVTSLTAKSVYPEKSVVLIKEIGDGVIPCSIPYMIQTLSETQQNLMGDQPLNEAGVEVIVERVVSFDPKLWTVTLESGTTITYERLVLATGSHPILPPIKGVEKKGVFTIRKSLSAMNTLREKAQKSGSVVIVGGGFIGVEFADELTRIPGLVVHLVEALPEVMSTAFDKDFCKEIEISLRESGVNLFTGRRVEEMYGERNVESVSLDGGEELECDLVIIGVGARPAVQLAKDAGLKISESRSIWVDSYMRTDRKGVFAVGDCAVKRDFFSRKAVSVMLASNATSEARIAGTNLYGIRVMRQVQGTISAFSTKIGGISYASAGMTCRTCREEGFRIVSAVASAPDRHPGALPGARQLKVKLVFANKSGELLGGQISGSDSVGELINVVALGIEKKVTVREMDMMQIATHPMLTSAPTVHPLINAAHKALGKFRFSSS